MNDIDKLIRLFEGADYFEDPPEEETRYPIWLGICVPVLATWVVVGWLYLSLAG